MPGLSWSALKIVAADGLVGRRGVALRTPILQDEKGRILLPSSVDDETVEPRQILPKAELRELLEGHIWIPVRVLEAKRGHILVVRSASFAAACRMVMLPQDLRWVDRHADLDIAYVPRESALRWREQCAHSLVRWAEKRIREHLGSSPFPASLERAQTLLEQALFVTDLGSQKRQRVFVLLGVILAELSPSSWPMLATAALAESPELDRAELDEEIETAQHELMASSRSARTNAGWASGYEHCLQPPSI